MKNIVRNVSPVGFSWLINCLMQGSLRISLAFLNLIVLSLRHDSVTKFGFIFFYIYITSLGTGAIIRVSRVFLLVKGFRNGRHIYAISKTPSLAIDQSRNSTSENFHQCGQCPKPDNPRPHKADEWKSLVRIGCSGGQPNGSMLVCDTLGGFIGMKGLCLKEKMKQRYSKANTLRKTITGIGTTL